MLLLAERLAIISYRRRATTMSRRSKSFERLEIRFTTRAPWSGALLAVGGFLSFQLWLGLDDHRWLTGFAVILFHTRASCR